MRTLPSPLLAILDEELLGPCLPEQAAVASRVGLRWLCLRARRLGTDARLRLGRVVQGRCPGVFLTVHGDPRALLGLAAPGLHLPSRGFDVASVRRSHPGVLLGVSCHTGRELRAAAAAGADYAVLSPFCEPTSKPPAGPVLGPDGFREAVRGVPIPVLALGGITPERVTLAAMAGAGGAAVLGSLFQATDLPARSRAYLAAAEQAWGRGRRRTSTPISGSVP
ncbi:MAG: thiamine phosphate synthase [Deferrisomatales bacterium]|nr:thiamine phosphate synthase [Deferrisomatales bacterium]